MGQYAVGAKESAAIPRPAATDAQDHEQNGESRITAFKGTWGSGGAPAISSFVNRLENLIGGEYGVLVDQVGQGSPAAKAALRPDDVICRYDGQEVFSPEQLVKLVRGNQRAEKSNCISFVTERPKWSK